MHTWISEEMLIAMREQQRMMEDLLLWGRTSMHVPDNRTYLRKILDSIKSNL
jgi:hypothetical protein